MTRTNYGASQMPEYSTPPAPNADGDPMPAPLAVRSDTEQPNLIDTVEKAILGLDFETATPDQMAAAITFIEALKARTRELDKQMEQAAIAWLQFHGDLTIGENRYYVGTVKHTKCINPKATIEALLVAADGALDGIEQCLVSQPFKAGATRTILGDSVFDSQFETIVMPDLKTGKPLRKVQKSNPKFLKGGSDAEA